MMRSEKREVREKAIKYKLDNHTYVETAKKFGYSMGYLFALMREYKQKQKEIWGQPQDLAQS